MPDTAQQGSIKRKELVGKLNPTCLQAFSMAAQVTKQRGNPYVELAHFFEQLVLTQRSDIDILLQSAGVDTTKLGHEFTRALDNLPRGSTSVEEFSDHIFHAIREAWNFGSLEFGDETVRSAYILLGALQVPALEALLLKISLEFDKIDPAAMAGQLDELLPDSVEGSPVDASAPAKPAPGGQSALDQYATDLTARARDGHIDPVIGREAEIRQIVDILMRRRQNNPILTGEAGVGKTAVVEGFALRLAQGDVPPQLKNVALHMLDVGLMQAGASMKGEFERRLKTVIEEVQSSDTPIILFIDEAHTLIGAGGAAGTGDAANLLKPALARGELRTIAATTWAEYKEHIEKDPALTRRFQVVKVEEPDEETAVKMLRGVAGVLEKHHLVEILDEALVSSVELSHRYIPGRQLPDKGISLLDTACARVAVSQHATPAEVEDLQRRLGSLEVEQGIIEREAAIGIDTAERMEAVEASIAESQAKLDDAMARWDAEKALIAEILDLRSQLRGEGEAIDDELPEPEEGEAPRPAPDRDRASLIDALRAKSAELAEAQGERPLILPSVDANAVASVVQDWTGIPMGRMLASETQKALGLAKILSERVIGQDHAMEMIANRVQTSRAGLDAPEKPIGVFMLAGSSGVGKTETALALAEVLYGGEQNLISINMSEYQEAHTVSTLKGAPPGYVGYGKGGVLTEAVRRRPYSVILLDEVEKAHTDVHEIFFQVFDKGMMDDSEGRRINFENTLILLTTNAGTDEIMEATDEGAKRMPAEELDDIIRPALLKIFPPALIGRLVTVPYYPLSEEMIHTIAGLKLRKIAKRLEEAHGAEMVLGDGVMPLITERCKDIASGGRMIDTILTNTLLPELSRGVLDRKLSGEEVEKVVIDADESGFTYAYS